MRSFLTGTTVVSFKYRDGVVMGADSRGSYGRLAKFEGIMRMFRLTDQTLVGVSGEISDMQHLMRVLEVMGEEDTRKIDPQSYHRAIQRLLYKARSEHKPLNLNVCVAGMGGDGADPRGRMLGCVDHLGNFFSSEVVCTGIGAYIVLPFLRSRIEGREDEITREEAVRLVEEAMRLLCYRACNASNEICIGYADGQDVFVSEPYRIETSWDIGLKEGEIVVE